MSDANLPATLGEGDDKVLPIVIYGLLLLGLATAGVTSVLGLIVAYVYRDKAGDRTRSHYLFQIRTCWMGLALCIADGVLFAVGAVLSLVLIGIPLLILAWTLLSVIGIWYAVRCIVGLYYLVQDQPYPRPDSWLI